MSVSYKKLWILLAERSLSKVDLRKMAGITPGILTKMDTKLVQHSMVTLKSFLQCLIYQKKKRCV